MLQHGTNPLPSASASVNKNGIILESIIVAKSQPTFTTSRNDQPTLTWGTNIVYWMLEWRKPPHTTQLTIFWAGSSLTIRYAINVWDACVKYLSAMLLLLLEYLWYSLGVRRAISSIFIPYWNSVHLIQNAHHDVKSHHTPK